MMTCKDCLHVEVCAYIKPDLPICSDFADIGEPKPDFCPNCGADMRKGENG